MQKIKGSVWDDLIDNPVERELLRIKSFVFSGIIIDYIKKHNLTQQNASELVVPRSRGSVTQ